jgi:hypothetical protein
MTSPIKNDTATPATPPEGFDLARINRLVSDLEQELAKAPADTPKLQDLREEIETLKNVLKSPKTKEGWIAEGLHDVRAGLQDVAARVEGEVLKDSPYIAEIGRILGLV